jgi:putative Ca2+/H+ antiporter (TMEM165/GDT1 family)
MEALLTSLCVVTVAEIGDRTQLLTFLLAYRFRRPLPILAGVFVATIGNHAVAALVGEWVGGLLTPGVLRWVLGISFIAMAAWILIPDKVDENMPLPQRYGAFMATVIAFFLAEIGDKTQIATVALAARFEVLLPVVLGTTAGMMIANAPAVMIGHFAARNTRLDWTRYVAAAIFALEAVLSFAGYGLGMVG